MITTGAMNAEAKRDCRYWWLICPGIVSVIVSLGIGTTKYAGDASGQWTLSRANGMCASSAGSLAQMMSARTGARCASIAGLEQWRGWLMIAGILAIAAGAAWAKLGHR